MHIKSSLSSLLVFALFASYTMCGDVVQIDEARINKHKNDIERRVYRNHYLKGGVYSALALVTVFSVYNYFNQPSLNGTERTKIRELLHKQTPEGASLASNSASTTLNFLQHCINVGSDVASFFGNGVLFVVQNVLFSAAVDVAAHRSQRVFKFPGELDWYITYETHLNELLEDYQGYAALLEAYEQYVSSEVVRVRESIVSQLPHVVEAVESVLAYMNYMHLQLEKSALDESTMVQEYLVTITNEFVSQISDDTSKLSTIAKKIKQFVTEIKSLRHRFVRLKRLRNR